MKRTSEELQWATIRSVSQWSRRQAEWVIEEQRKSGLSARRFGDLHGVGVARMAYWRARLKEATITMSPARSRRCELVELSTGSSEVLSSGGGARVRVTLRSGIRLSVGESIAPDVLRGLVQALEDVSC